MSQHFLPGSYEDLFFRAQALAQAGEPGQSIDLFSHLLERLGRLNENVLAHRPGLRNVQLRTCLELTGLLQSEGRYAEAIEVEGRLLQTHPDRSRLWRRDLAVLRMAGGEVDRGIAELQALAAEDPDDAWNWIVLANEARIEDRFAESQSAYAQALGAVGRVEESKKDPKLLAEIHFGRFRLNEAMGRPDEAVAAWEEALTVEPTVKDTIRSVYQMLTAAGRYEQAQEYVARDGNALRAGLQRGIIAELTGHPEQATKEFQELAALDPMKFEQGHDCWAEAVLRQKNPEPLLEQLRQLLSRHGSLRLLVLAGIAWAMHGDRELAQGLFEQSVGLLRRSRPAKQKLDSADWRLLASLVSDEAIKTALKPYFAVVERVLE
jgi:tetratricopeptide (TPR) repeat protein